MARKSRAKLYEIYTAICKGIEAGTPRNQLQVSLGVSKSAINDYLRRMKEKGYISGDGRDHTLKVLRLPPKADFVKLRAKPVRTGTTISDAVKAQNERIANGFDPDVHALLMELADPRGAHLYYLFPPEWVSKTTEQGYVTMVGDKLFLTATGRKQISFDGKRLPPESREQKLARAVHLSQALATLLAELMAEDLT